jgi:hypothetical protein
MPGLVSQCWCQLNGRVTHPEFVRGCLWVVHTFNLTLQLYLGGQEGLVSGVKPELEVFVVVQRRIDCQDWGQVTSGY